MLCILCDNGNHTKLGISEKVKAETKTGVFLSHSIDDDDVDNIIIIIQIYARDKLMHILTENIFISVEYLLNSHSLCVREENIAIET